MIWVVFFSIVVGFLLGAAVGAWATDPILVVDNPLIKEPAPPVYNYSAVYSPAPRSKRPTRKRKK